MRKTVRTTTVISLHWKVTQVSARLHKCTVSRSCGYSGRKLKIMLDRTKLVIEKVAFEGDKRGYHFKATYLKEPKGEALIEISKDEKIVREFLFPAYKIWNISAHADDIIDGLEKESDEGLLVAGSNGLGGNAYSGS